MKRTCDSCGRKLTGPKGHGWPTPDGRAVWCGCCTFPKSCEKKRRRKSR